MATNAPAVQDSQRATWLSFRDDLAERINSPGVKSRIHRMLGSTEACEAFVASAISTVMRSPKLWSCTPESILQCAIQAAQLQLFLDDGLGHAYILPFGQGTRGGQKKSEKKTATFIVGYRGYTELAWRSAQIIVDAGLHREGDTVFDFRLGTDGFLHHVPSDDVGAPVLHAWAMATFPDGRSRFVVLPLSHLKLIRARSPGRNDGPWVNDEPAMQLKSAVRQVIKLLPLRGPLAEAFRTDETTPTHHVIDVPFKEDGDDDDAPPTAKRDALKDELADRRKRSPKPSPPPPQSEPEIDLLSGINAKIDELIERDIITEGWVDEVCRRINSEHGDLSQWSDIELESLRGELRNVESQG